jgi:hypothetical protein
MASTDNAQMSMVTSFVRSFVIARLTGQIVGACGLSHFENSSCNILLHKPFTLT